MSDLALLSTAGIQDPQVRNYLDRFSQVWDEQTRGSGRFVRRDEVGQLTGDALTQALSDGVVGGPRDGLAASINSAIRNLTDSLRRSLVYQVLESSVRPIDLDALRQKAGADIETEQKTRNDKDGSLASAINRIWGYIGGSTAIIEDGTLASSTPSSAVATKWSNVVAAVTDPNTGNVSSAAILTETRTYANNADSTLNAIYSVKAQVSSGGATVVGGFALAATSGAGSAQGPTIDFGVLANKFFIAAPVSGYNPATEYTTNTDFPFIVVTTPTTINGVTYPAGVYMKKAAIGQAAIGTAEIETLGVKTANIDNLAVTTGKIANLAVDTLQIANQAVTFPQSAYTSTFVSALMGSPAVVQSLTVSSTGAPALLVFGAHIFCTTFQHLFMELQRDGVTIFKAGPYNGTAGSAIQGEGMETATLLDTPSAGSHTYELYVGGNVGDTITYASRCITYLEVKK